MQIANKNSRLAKKIRSPDKTKVAIFKLKMNKPAITVVIKKPSRAAKTFGALSIILCGKFSVLLNERLAKLMGLNFSSVKALMKKSAIKKIKNNTEFKRKARTIIPIVNKEFNRVTCSLIR